MTERDKSLRIMNITAAVLFGLTALLYIYVSLFPNEIIKLFTGMSDVNVSKETMLYMIFSTIKPAAFTAIGITGFTRKSMSFKSGLITAVGSGILWLFPPAIVKTYIVSVFARLSGIEQFSYLNTLNSAVSIFSFMSSIGILLIFGSAVAETYAVKTFKS
ncbi:MAG: hypothetical protein K2J37_00900 [Ruminococcus sp.]|nr:hypothetical protein [Ruminococcus sp.]MDE6784800.1 hypothetical protein [Ruminococcus sp.]